MAFPLSGTRSQLAFFRRSIAYFRADAPLVVLWIALILLSTALGLLVAWPMAVLVDTVLAPVPAPRDWIHRLFLAPLPDSKVSQVIGLATAGLILKMLQDVLATAQAVVSNRINYAGLMRVRCDLYRKLQALNLSYHRTQPQGDAIYRLTSDATGFQTILSVLVSAFVAALTLIVMTILLGSRNATLTALAFSIAPLLAITNIVFARRFSRRTLECKESDTRFTSTVQRSMSCIGLTQAFDREDDEYQRFRGTLGETIAAWWRLNREQFAYNLIIGLLFGVGSAIIFGYGGYLAHVGRLSVGELMVFMSYLGMLWNPLCQLTGFVANVQAGAAGARRVFEVLDRDPVIADRRDARQLPRRPRAIELDHVSFSYGDGRSVLEEVSARIEPGQMVAFVGASGTGKSTLLHLLPRFFDPRGGAIRLDGIDVREVRVRDLRRHVALVLQDSVILPTTIAENIAYGRPTATREQVATAARLAGAAEFIEACPKGYDTPIAEGGSNLSGGQRQRLSIARALLTEAPIIVLDEPTSALDPHHEAAVTDALAGLKGSRTVILVSHRLSTVVECDQIFVMDRGRIVERGTHAELMAARGLYHEMARQQFTIDDSEDVAAPTRLAA